MTDGEGHLDVWIERHERERAGDDGANGAAAPQMRSSVSQDDAWGDLALSPGLTEVAGPGQSSRGSEWSKGKKASGASLAKGGREGGCTRRWERREL